jgi:DNA-binding response OmpR family regulator
MMRAPVFMITKKQRILVVDDEHAIRDLVRSYLTRSGYGVTLAANGPETMTALDEGPIDLVILDIVLGEEDGFEILSSIRASRPNLPVIMMSGIGHREDLLREAQARRANGLLSKNSPLNQLLMEVHRVLKFDATSASDPQK